MTDRPAAIRAQFADYRTVKSRSTLQLIFEVAIEQQAEVFAALGFPLPSAPLWCAVARLNDTAGTSDTPAATGTPASPGMPEMPTAEQYRRVSANEPGASEVGAQPFTPPVIYARRSQAAKERYAMLDEGEKAVARAALLAKDARFQAWAGEECGRTDALTQGDAAEYIRMRCHVDSRRELATDDRARAFFESMVTEYEIETGLRAEPR